MKYEIDDEMLVRSVPIYTGDTMIASKRSCVITKEEFLACYNKWVSKDKSKPTGKWVAVRKSTAIGSMLTAVCSRCGGEVDQMPCWKYVYCPICGADMQGEEENEKRE